MVRTAVSTLSVTERPAAPQSPDEFLREYGEALIKRDWTNLVIGTQNPASDVAGVPSTVSASHRPRPADLERHRRRGARRVGMQSTWLLDDVDPTMGTQSAEKATIHPVHLVEVCRGPRGHHRVGK